MPLMVPIVPAHGVVQTLEVPAGHDVRTRIGQEVFTATWRKVPYMNSE